MDRATFDRETKRHRKVYEPQRDHIKKDYAGKYVVLTQGQLIITDSYDEAKGAVKALLPAPEYSLIFPAEMDPPFELGYDL